MAPRLLDVVTHPTAEPVIPPTATPTRRSTPHPGRGAISNPTALLAANLTAVARAPGGKRRVTLYGAARGIARIVATGAITPEHALAELTRAGQEAQQNPHQIHDAITGAFRDEGVPL